MKRLVFVGSVLGTIAVFSATCLAVLATLIWLIRQWEPAPWVVWAVGLGMTGTAVAVIWRWWRLPVERRFRFSVRGMLVGTTLFALWFGTAGTELLRWGRMAAVIRDLSGRGVMVEYYYPRPQEPLRNLSLRLFCCDLFEGIQFVEIRRDQGLTALLEHADDLHNLEAVNFHGGWISDAGLARVEELNRFPKLRFSLISGCMITDAGLERLAAWRRLEALVLHDCAKITDAGLAYLKELPNLRELTLIQGRSSGKMPVTDAGLAYVADLQQLQELRIMRIPITDAGIDQLHNMPNLKRVHLYRTEVTNSGDRRLCEALPDCLVTGGTSIVDR